MTHAGRYRNLNSHIVQQKPPWRGGRQQVKLENIPIIFHFTFTRMPLESADCCDYCWRVIMKRNDSHLTAAELWKAVSELSTEWSRTHIVFCRVSVRKRLCALYVCMCAQMAPHLRGACVLVSCNSRGWMEDRLSGSQGRVDRLLKTVERDTTASAHAYSQNRHTILVGVIAPDRQPSECLLLVALALLQSSQAFHLTPASCAVRNGKGNHC